MPGRHNVLQQQLMRMVGRAMAHIFPGYGHQKPFTIRDAEVSAFIDATLPQ
jgi:hypothetical protein